MPAKSNRNPVDAPEGDPTPPAPDDETVVSNPPDEPSTPGDRPEGVDGPTCVNCGQPAIYRTSSKAANQLDFCEQHRPQEGVERLDI